MNSWAFSSVSFVKDQVFASGMMGPGCAFVFDGDTVFAPADAKITLIAPTKHAFGLTLQDGTELLLHVGLDTVNLDGKGFTILVKEGDSVKHGTPIMKIDRAFMKSQGIDLTTPLIVTSPDVQASFDAKGPVRKGQKVGSLAPQTATQSAPVSAGPKTGGKYGELIDTIMDKIGGQDNLVFHTHCITRLRFNVKDKDKVDLKAIENTKGAVGAQWSGDQLQVIIGQDVGKVYNQIVDRYHLSTDDTQETGEKKKFSVGAILDAITGSITPLLPLMVAAGLIEVITILLKTFSIVPLDNPTYLILSFVGDAGFYFLPVFTAWSAARKFKAASRSRCSWARCSSIRTLSHWFRREPRSTSSD